MSETYSYDQSPYTIRCEWGASGISVLAPVSEVIIVVDIFSFSTGVEIATSRGARVYPYRRDYDAASSYARRLGAIIAGSRDSSGYTISPSSLMTLPVNSSVVLSSPNDSVLSYSTMSRQGCTIIAGSFRNAAAVVRRVADVKGTISVIPVGETWPDGRFRPSLEDWLGAGAIIAGLKGTRSPEAQAAASFYYNAWERLTDILHECASGQALTAQGFEKDIRLAAELNVSRCVPVLRDGAFQNETIWETV